MNFTYEDLYFHQGLLKTLMKAVEPNLQVCFLTENHINHTFFLDDGQSMNKLAYIVLGIRKGPGNYTCMQVASIYSNGYIQNSHMSIELLYSAQLWVTLIETQQQRYKRRIQTIRDELFAVVYHPDNFRRLVDIEGF